MHIVALEGTTLESKGVVDIRKRTGNAAGEALTIREGGFTLEVYEEQVA